ncbi:MAG TPA: hypothetical protein VHU88_12505 [Sporichthyaceae bacterium]|nr:hypothetical protein [Sporichthyaceae bacterium]
MATRWSVIQVGVLGGTVALLAACGHSSSSLPQGLSGGVAATPAALTDQARSFVHDQETDADAAARTTLAPAAGSFLAGKTKVSYRASTTPDNGDENPYAIWPVTITAGSVKAGDVLVDNFNNKSNNQGTGTTIVNVHPDGTTDVFADLSKQRTTCPGGVGLTTAMVQLKTGWVIVGSLPSQDGQMTTADNGCLLFLSPAGKIVETLSGPQIAGPWDAAVDDQGSTATLFFTNVLQDLDHSATAKANKANVTRLNLTQTADTPPKVTGSTVVADGFPEAGDASAFVKGPTGLTLSNGTLYVADTLDNSIAAVPNALTRTDSAGTGTTLTKDGQLANPLGLTTAPNGNLLAANATNGKIVEITTVGQQVGEFYAIENVGQDPPGNGDLFGIAVNQAGTGILFVKDDENSLALLSS